ncbi:PTS mannitol transporter subunit IICBA [Bacillus sp. REN16]|uniref:PTS mannitol transporter subunit IICBA n=1 Tax=Bacillus sp. REN16 TaxID=2887296 RepID=UPI001E28B02E|nr:PTS mannitol transporter subunit IICBA [Bacillus sp. REN16]MCC3358176.1 PTS mannitol transporter subunit IICBA [Bacillus sp. REN16]
MAQQEKGIKVGVQKFGNFLSSMVMPNIGAFIAWGLITALFIEAGWFPNEELASLVGPMVTYLLPLLIGYTGGKLIYDTRGGVVGAIATMGVIVGADIPMFLGAMIMGPIGGWVIKKFDSLIEGKIKTGFEMLVNNFSSGILGGILAILSYLLIGPGVTVLTGWLVTGVEWMLDVGVLPLTSIIIEPAKILFLNNAINHGVLSPIGLEQAKQTGSSILFLLEANPGPGMGVLLAYWFFGKGTAKQTAPGASIIHFFGGIHEIYFPYVLMNPLLIIAVVLGGISGVFTLTVLGGGLVAPSSPGSILAILAVTPAGNYFANISGVAVALIVSFIGSSLVLKTSKAKEGNIEEASQKMQEMKGKKSSVAGALAANKESNGEFDTTDINHIIFACDAGMGSSAMGASLLRKKVKEAGLNMKVTNTSISNLPSDAKLVITQEELTPRAKQKVPNAHHISVENFLSSPKYDELINRLKTEDVIEENPNDEIVVDSTPTNEGVLRKENIFLNKQFSSKEEAIRFAGRVLVDGGYVEESYIDAMIERDQMTTTYMGNDVAIPHGTDEAKKSVLKSGVTIIQIPDGVDYDGQKARLIFGIAGKDGGHLEILSAIAITCSEMENVEKMATAKTVDEILDIIGASFDK